MSNCLGLVRLPMRILVSLNLFSKGNREQGTGNREQGTGNRE
ncbi:hypothetical protein [Moorena producens]